jgi:hypothetical protein
MKKKNQVKCCNLQLGLFKMLVLLAAPLLTIPCHEKKQSVRFPPGFSTLIKANCKDGAGNHGPDAHSLQKECKPNLIPILRKNLTSQRAKSATTLATSNLLLFRIGISG